MPSESTSSKTCRTSSFRAAWCRMVCPFLLRSARSAPASRSIFTLTTQPACTAFIKGVDPSLEIAPAELCQSKRPSADRLVLSIDVLAAELQQKLQYIRESLAGSVM
eukprot:m.559459 g.559459  ORF g.559459 m.559459 type:complete len:107 (+) comp57773_c0_seq18:315-635(+)